MTKIYTMEVHAEDDALVDCPGDVSPIKFEKHRLAAQQDQAA